VFSRSELRLVYAGRLSADRGAARYIEVLRCLLDQGIPARLTLAGVFTPASEEQAVRQQMHDLESRVELCGWVPYSQMPAFLQAADVGLAILQPEPRYVAALPVKMFEYMAAGLPVLASDFPLIRSIFEAVHFGALVNPLASPQTIAGILADWWQHPEIPRQLGENGRLAVLREFNWEALMEKLVSLYRDLLSKSHNG
jgi:glycosyltransferase involved in cell wall biosynthesis